MEQTGLIGSLPGCIEQTTIVAPALNECDGIMELSTRLHKLYPGICFIIADDGSIDGTQDSVSQCIREGHNIHLLDRSMASVHGLTASVLDGILQSKTKYVVVMDADMQHPPEYVGEIISRLNAGDDLVIGTRMPLVGKWTLFRIVASRTANRLARLRLLFCGVSAQDPISGFFGMRTEFAKKLIRDNKKRFQLRGYKVLFDFLKVIPYGTNISEVIYNFNLRKKGHSKMSLRISWLFFVSFFK